MPILTNKLKGYDTRNPKKKKFKQEVLGNAQKIYNIRNDIIKAFESKIFFKRSNIDNINKVFSGPTDMSEVKDEESREKSKKDYNYPDWILVSKDLMIL